MEGPTALLLRLHFEHFRSVFDRFCQQRKAELRSVAGSTVEGRRAGDWRRSAGFARSCEALPVPEGNDFSLCDDEHGRHVSESGQVRKGSCAEV